MLASDDLKESLSYRFLNTHKVCELLNQSFYSTIMLMQTTYISNGLNDEVYFINKVDEFGYEKKPFYEFIKICAHQR